jgi:hypothetical protein
MKLQDIFQNAITFHDHEVIGFLIEHPHDPLKTITVCTKHEAFVARVRLGQGTSNAVVTRQDAEQPDWHDGLTCDLCDAVIIPARTPPPDVAVPEIFAICWLRRVSEVDQPTSGPPPVTHLVPVTLSHQLAPRRFASALCGVRPQGPIGQTATCWVEVDGPENPTCLRCHALARMHPRAR